MVEPSMAEQHSVDIAAQTGANFEQPGTQAVN
jgi:hypothetical protein